MKFGIMFANAGPFGLPEQGVHLARCAEEVGVESLWTVEHVVVPVGYQAQYPYSSSGKMPGPENSPIPDPVVWLSYIAGATQRIRLATGITAWLGLGGGVGARTLVASGAACAPACTPPPPRSRTRRCARSPVCG